jgi:hypothetical protein
MFFYDDEFYPNYLKNTSKQPAITLEQLPRSNLAYCLLPIKNKPKQQATKQAQVSPSKFCQLPTAYCLMPVAKGLLPPTHQSCKAH